MRSSWKVGLAAAVLIAAAFAGFATFRLQLLEALARRELAAFGLQDASLRVAAAGLAEARVVDVDLGAEAQAEAIRLRYGLLPPRLLRVEIDGLVLDASHPDQGLLGKLQGGGGAGGALPEIVLNDARIEVDTSQGRAAIQLSGRYGREGGRAAGEFRIEGPPAQGRFSMALAGPFDAGAYDVEGEIVEVEIAGQRIERLTVEAAMLLEDGIAAIDGDIAVAAPTALGPATARLPFAARIEPARITLRIDDGEAAAAERAVSAQGLSAMLIDAGRAELRVAAESVATGVAAPFAIEMKATEVSDGFEFELAATSAGATLGGRGKHAPGSGVGQLQLALQPLRFAHGGLQPAKIAPALALLEDVSGAVAGDAALRWRTGAVQGAGALRFDDLSFKVLGLTLEGLGGALRFTELWPLTTATGQVLHARRLTAGAALEKVSLSFRLDGGAGALEIARLQARFAGGDLVVANARIEPLAGRNPLVMQVHDVDLAALLALVGLEGLTGRGRVSGVLPLVVTASDVLVEGGEIAATGPGVLSFRSEQAKQALAAGGDYAGLALQALEDFRYQKLSLAVDKAEGGRAVVSLATLGANPEVLDGHPFAINVTLNADANALFAQSLEAWRLSQGALATIVRGR